MKRIVFIISLLGIGLCVFLLLPVLAPAADARQGFTYSLHAARYLGLDDTAAFTDVIATLQPEIVRLPIYWDIVEAEQGMYDWSLYDEQMDALALHGGRALLAIGHKLPRWPECHIPAWLQDAPVEEVEPALLRYLETAVNRYKQHPALEAWQVENEALFPFGDCPDWSADRARLRTEVRLVKSLDPEHAVLTTDSGELSLWWRTATLPVDDLGISLYRVVYSGGRNFKWPLNPYFYRLRLALVQPFVDALWVTELQAEPWGSVDVLRLSDDEIERSFPPAALAERYDYARRVNAATILVWGVEWWYYRSLQGDARYWDAAKALFNES